MEGSGTSPLENELVLDGVFKYLRVSDLKNCRRVCKAWRDCGSIAMRQAVITEFFDNPADFLKLVQSDLSTFSKTPFVSNYKLSSITEANLEFWTFCGSSIKTLTLHNVECESAECFRHAVFKSCTNLERLSFENYPKNNENNHPKEEPTVWIPPRFKPNTNLKCLEFIDDFNLPDISFMEILSHFPAVEVILLNFSGRDYFTERFFHSLEIARNYDDRWWKIKNISFNFVEWQNPLEFVQVLIRGNLALEILDVGGIQRTEDANALRSILIAHSTSLKTLNTWGKLTMNALYDPRNNISFKNVKELIIWNADLISTTFLRSFPSLRKLELKWTQPKPEFSEFRQQPFNNWAISSCRELTLVSEHFTPVDLQALLLRLPNLEYLTISDCSNKMFRVICKRSQNLVYLNLIQSLVNDSGISGLDDEDVERIEEEGRNGWFWWRPITVPRPNISNLSILKWFSWTPEPSSNHCLGVSAAICGVEQLPQLQHLRLKRSTSRLKWEQLCAKFPWRECHRDRTN